MSISTNREQYISPACGVLELKPEGLIALSGGGSTESSGSWGSENWPQG